jgi:4-hydroxybenzoate polyprenyltransferase
MKDFLNLIRWKSVLLCIIALIVVRSFIINPFYAEFAGGLESAISNLEYFIFCFSVILLVVASVLINEYFDQDIDKINRAKKDLYIGRTISEKRVLSLFYVLSIASVAIGYVIGYLNGFLHLGSLMIVFVFMSYFYSLKYKRGFLVGNIVVAILYSMIVFLPILFEIFALMNNPGGLFKVIITPLKENLLYVALFFTVITFLLTLIREIVCDMQDEEGDRECGCNSLVVLLGEKKTKNIVYVLTAIFIAVTLFFLFTYYTTISLIVCALLVCVPMLFFVKELKSAKSIQDYGFLSELLRMIFVSGLFMIINIY